MNVAELRRALEEAESILSSAGAKTPGKDLKAFLAILNGRDDQDVDAFFAELRQRLGASSATPKKPTRVAEEDTVQRYFQRLNDVGTDKAAFGVIFADLMKDKSVLKEEADAIAHRFTGGRSQWPTKSDALTAISEWFEDKSYQAVKMHQVDKGTPWKTKRA
jgi:hypothetical protein